MLTPLPMFLALALTAPYSPPGGGFSIAVPADWSMMDSSDTDGNAEVRASAPLDQAAMDRGEFSLAPTALVFSRRIGRRAIDTAQALKGEVGPLATNQGYALLMGGMEPLAGFPAAWAQVSYVFGIGTMPRPQMKERVTVYSRGTTRYILRFQAPVERYATYMPGFEAARRSLRITK